MVYECAACGSHTSKHEFDEIGRAILCFDCKNHIWEKIQEDKIWKRRFDSVDKAISKQEQREYEIVQEWLKSIEIKTCKTCRHEHCSEAARCSPCDDCQDIVDGVVVDPTNWEPKNNCLR